MGRNAQPIDILTAKGKKHLTKAEKESRKQAEADLKLGGDKLICPMYVKGDPIAYKKWRDLIYDYNKAKALGMEIIKSSDAGILARYCKTHSEYIKLLEQKSRIEKFEVNYEKLLEYFEPDLLVGLDTFFKFGPVMQLDNAINKKMDQLVKMEDRLFLNPLSKIKNVPKKEPEKANPLADKGFGNV